MAFGRNRDAGSVDDERERLRLQRAELEELKRELGERIAAVREREDELRAVIANGNGIERAALPVGLLPAAAGPDEAAVERRVAELAERERAVAAREHAARQSGETVADGESRALEAELKEARAELDRRTAELQRVRAQSPAERDAEQVAKLEARLQEIKEAEKAFLRTQQELATRSEAVAARERLVAQRERELDEREDGWGGAPDLAELESRLRRLETRGPTGEQTAGFSGGFRKLQQQGTRPRQ